MREYGQIQSGFWQAPDIFGDDDHPGLSDGAKLLACFLLSGPPTNGVGCFTLGNGTLHDFTRWSSEQCEERFAELSENGFAYRQNGVVILPNFLRWNRVANGNVAKARFADWKAVPKGVVKAFAARAMLEFCDFWTEEHRTVLLTVAETVGDTVITVLKNQHPIPSHPIPSREHPNLSCSIEPKSPKAERKSPTTRKPTGEPDGFAEFYAAYPRKVGRPKAALAFAKLTDDDRRRAIAAIPAFAASWKWQHEPDYIPHPTTWLNQARWNDDPPSLQPPRQPPMKLSRQGAIVAELLKDPRHADTAQRQLAHDRNSRGVPAINGTFAALSAGPGGDLGDDAGLDGRADGPRHR